jgi:hypothetical protein
MSLGRKGIILSILLFIFGSSIIGMSLANVSPVSEAVFSSGSICYVVKGNLLLDQSIQITVEYGPGNTSRIRVLFSVCNSKGLEVSAGEIELWGKTTDSRTLQVSVPGNYTVIITTIWAIRPVLITVVQSSSRGMMLGGVLIFIGIVSVCHSNRKKVKAYDENQ